MRSDALLAFTPVGAPQAILGVAVPSLQTIDLLGQGVGQPPNNIIGNAALFGEDPGIGAFRPELNVTTGVVFASGTSLNVALQYAPDTGVGGGYLPGTWVTVGESGAILTAALGAGLVIARLPWLPAAPPNLRPRFIRLLYTPVGTFTTGTIASALVVLVRDDQANKFAAKNYTVS